MSNTTKPGQRFDPALHSQVPPGFTLKGEPEDKAATSKTVRFRHTVFSPSDFTFAVAGLDFTGADAHLYTWYEDQLIGKPPVADQEITFTLHFNTSIDGKTVDPEKLQKLAIVADRLKQEFSSEYAVSVQGRNRINITYTGPSSDPFQQFDTIKNKLGVVQQALAAAGDHSPLAAPPPPPAAAGSGWAERTNRGALSADEIAQLVRDHIPIGVVVTVAHHAALREELDNTLGGPGKAA